MKTIKKLTKTVDYDSILSIKCDLCGLETKKENWSKDSGGIEETEIRYKTGELWPDGGSGVETTFDLYPSCFSNRLAVWLKSQGATPTIKEWSR